MSIRDFVGKSICVLACWMCSALPAAAQGVGAIGGLIDDNSGAILPGVTVTLSNPRGTIGGNQTTVTDERGAFQFLRLVPGTYTVRAELQGFRPAVQENIATLKKRGYKFVEPDSGFLACGTYAKGRLANPVQIVEEIVRCVS